MAQISREYGISEATFYPWKAKFGGMQVSEVKRLKDWCSDKQVVLHWIEPGKPTQNAYIERFNETFRREVLNANVFSSLAQVRRTVAAWLVEYNTERPHQALGFKPPVEYRQAA